MLNYKQLYYFWNVAKAGSITRAAEQLHLTPQTISGQLAELERSLGADLFRRTGRRLELTPAGEMANEHAREIFQIGNELEQTLKRGSTEQSFRVGVADAVPKSIAYQLLAPAIALADPVRLICYEDKLERLFAELAIHKLDLVIADQPLPSELGVKAFNHSLGYCDIALYAVPELAARYRKGFPQSLNDAPFLLLGDKVAMQAGLQRWFQEQDIRPRIVGQFDDSALMKAFGRAGAGVFPAPAIMEEEIQKQQGAELIGHIKSVVVNYYAISVERRLSHPAVLAVSAAARESVFAKRVL
ncbi:LysR family transcriptional activator of nhaA [Iodobacter fluviatilis]|uniref:LysR family transcriptional activator of nhaA n=2 Tax=Iodobacter fluviatilis TaxID=537 RepID=A0A377Q6V1_9NEIS|nr:LysR family transcriptional activator of nhaA [Iodobacter fluviatilis]STQ90440.1 Na(+)/H(+) antiporter regulatory protein [Iodobacter fluviatilis]